MEELNKTKTQIGLLSAEESTVNPSSPFPSFLEMNLVESAMSSARILISSSIDTATSYIEHMLQRDINHGPSSLKHKMAHFLVILGRRFGPEIRMLLIYHLERRSLFTKNCASISESVYGLKRSKVEVSSSNSVLQEVERKDRERSALALALVDYFKERLDHLFEYERNRHLEESNTQDSRQHLPINTDSGTNIPSTVEENNGVTKTLRRAFLLIYPFLHFTTGGIDIAYRLAYLLGSSIYFCPSLHALGLVVRRITKADIESNDQKVAGSRLKNIKSNPEIRPDALLRNHRQNIKRAVALALTSVTVLTFVANFRKRMLEIRQRWTTEESPSIADQTTLIKAKLPPPQPPTIISGQESTNLIDKSLCPLCNQTRINPVASTSGYVYCYRCITMHIRENGNYCPLTYLECKESQLIRIYEPMENLNT